MFTLLSIQVFGSFYEIATVVYLMSPMRADKKTKYDKYWVKIMFWRYLHENQREYREEMKRVFHKRYMTHTDVMYGYTYKYILPRSVCPVWDILHKRVSTGRDQDTN